MWIPIGSYMVRPASLYWVLHIEAMRKGRLASRELCSTVAAVGSGLSLPMWIPTGSYMVRPASLYWVLHIEAMRKGRLASRELCSTVAAVRANRELCSTVVAVGSGLSLPMWIPVGSYIARSRVLVRTPPQGGAHSASALARASHDSAHTSLSRTVAPPSPSSTGAQRPLDLRPEV
jgi:hypothetical protein